MGTPLLSSRDYEVGPGVDSDEADTVSSPDLDGEDFTGEFLQFGGDPQYYEITAHVDDLVTLSPTIRSEWALTAEQIIIRPQETKKISLFGPSNSTPTSSTVTVYYWAQPTLPVGGRDMVLLPLAELLTKTSLSKLGDAKITRPVSGNEVREILNKAVRMNPEGAIPIIATGINGHGIGSNPMSYKTRGCPTADRRRTGWTLQ
jgi:hypothetical protein